MSIPVNRPLEWSAAPTRPSERRRRIHSSAASPQSLSTFQPVRRDAVFLFDLWHRQLVVAADARDRRYRKWTCLGTRNQALIASIGTETGSNEHADIHLVQLLHETSPERGDIDNINHHGPMERSCLCLPQVAPADRIPDRIRKSF